MQDRTSANSMKVLLQRASFNHLVGAGEQRRRLTWVWPHPCGGSPSTLSLARRDLQLGDPESFGIGSRRDFTGSCGHGDDA
jgi:hypothetical protein